MKTPLQKIEAKIYLDYQAFAPRLQAWKDTQEKLVFTNGCFDILHKGHIDYLANAAHLGSKLIIGLNSDHSVQKLKGKHRPIQDQSSRALTIAALSFVDAVILFEEDTPYQLISHIIPQILVKGADYQAKDIVGYDIVTQAGGEVKTIPFIPGYSTSAIECKIIENQKLL